MQKYLFRNISVVNEGEIRNLDVRVVGDRIDRIDTQIVEKGACHEINGEGKYLFPGVIDDQVHFREPGLTHKATIGSESRAAVAGGVTSFMEMPNTIPNALTLDLLEDKYRIAAHSSPANYSFYMGVSNQNADEALRVNALRNDICGLKIFLGSSTGNMLVDNYVTLEKVFGGSELLIATHCEDETIIRERYQSVKQLRENLRPEDHALIRNDESCYASTLRTVQLAQKHGTRLHVLHQTTEKELSLFGNMMPLREKRITAEVCVHHLHFTSDDYARLGYQIKCNPSIKEPFNREALWKALLDDRIDVIATDHAPHCWEEKNPPYESAHAGLPLVQHPLLLMLYYHRQGRISLERIAEKMSHAVADCFQIADRGYIREGYHADLVVVDPGTPYTVTPENLLYHCGWSPLMDFTFPDTIEHTFVNGHPVYSQDKLQPAPSGQRLRFNRS